MKARRAVSGWRAWAIPGALILTALILYLPGITWGLPYATGPDRIYSWGDDELGALGPLAQVYSVVFHGNSEFDPRYPLLPYVIQALFMSPYIAWLWISGGLSSFSTTYPYGLADPVTSLAGLALAGRLPSLVLISTVPAVAYFTARIFWDKRTAVLSGFFVLLLYPLFYYSRTSNVEGQSLFWTSLGLFIYALCLKQGFDMRRAALFGAAAALAVATKDQSYAIFVTAGIVLAVRQLSTGPGEPRPGGRAVKPLLVSLLVAAPAYLLASGLAFNPGRFADHVHFILHGSGEGSDGYYSNPPTSAGYLRVLWTVARHVVDAMGLPMAITGVAGMVLAAMKDRTALLWTLPIIGLIAGVIIPVRFALLRFLIPAAYVLAFFAAYSLSHVFGSTHRDDGSSSARARRAAAWLIVAAIAGWSLLRGADLTYEMTFDSRHDLAAWLRENARAGDRIGYYDPPEKLPHLDSSLVTVSAPYNRGVASAPGTWPEFVLLIPQRGPEIAHEGALPRQRFEELNTGELGYRLVYSGRTESLFRRSPINWMNPLVRAYAREDVLPQLKSRPVRE